MRRLYKTCPKYRYLATDYEFTKRLDAIVWVGEKYFELCQYFYDKILLSQSVISAMILSDQWLEGKLQYSNSDMQDAKIGHISTLKSIHQALIEFCDDIGVDSNQLVQWMTPSEGRENINEYLELVGVDADKDFTFFIKNKFLTRWGCQGNLR